jgi:hypothetical protein
MAPGDPVHPGPPRTRVALVLLLLGLLMILFAWADYVFLTASSVTPEVVARVNEPSADDSTRALEALSTLLVVGLLLTLIVLVGSHVLVRAARRYRAVGNRARSPATPSEDVWSLHRAPPLEDEEDEVDRP